MKKLILVLLLVSIISLIGYSCSPGESESYTIKVSGTAGVEFVGSYGGISLKGETLMQSVAGVVPAEYTLNAYRDSIVTCSFVKQVEDGTLNVQILKDGQVLAQSGTSAPFGSVILTTN